VSYLALALQCQVLPHICACALGRVLSLAGQVDFRVLRQMRIPWREVAFSCAN
jgi:hypothetical protein